VTPKTRPLEIEAAVRQKKVVKKLRSVGLLFDINNEARWYHPPPYGSPSYPLYYPATESLVYNF